MLTALAECAPSTLVLLDGYYYTVPSVTHKELLYALDAGVRVIGAASLGALRAVELAPFGMEGTGRVFEAYRSGVLDGDDEVALLHAAAEHGYRPTTVALVEVRFALERLVAEGAVAADTAGRLIDSLKALPFTARDLARIEELARSLADGLAVALRRELARYSVKQDDARLALELAMAAPVPRPLPFRARRRTATGFLSVFKGNAVPGPPLRLKPGAPRPTIAHAWSLAQVLHPGAVGFVTGVRGRALLAAAAAHAGLAPPPGGEERRARALERHHERRFGRPCLPRPEYAEEARIHLLAREARRVFGADAALVDLARRRGLDPAVEGDDFLRHLAADPDLVPGWDLARAFSFHPAFRPALEAAAAAEEIHRCFQRWTEGARVAREDLRQLAADLWGCSPGEVLAEGGRRGLVPSVDLADGLYEALELVAAAERLPKAINDYPAKRQALLRTAL